MKRGEFYFVDHVSSTDRPRHIVVVVSRQDFVDLQSVSTVVCAPVRRTSWNPHTEVPVGPEDGLAVAGVIHCSDLQSIDRFRLTNYVGSLGVAKLELLNEALRVALGLND